jgi:hypothetical protein
MPFPLGTHYPHETAKSLLELVGIAGREENTQRMALSINPEHRIGRLFNPFCFYPFHPFYPCSKNL